MVDTFSSYVRSHAAALVRAPPKEVWVDRADASGSLAASLATPYMLGGKSLMLGGSQGGVQRYEIRPVHETSQQPVCSHYAADKANDFEILMQADLICRIRNDLLFFLSLIMV